MNSSTSLEELPRAIVWISTQLGEHVDVRVPGLDEAEDHRRRSGKQHKPAEPEASGDDPAHYR
jgi:hypothetical protein